MIVAVHALLYSDDPPATRQFLGDVLGWPSVEDAGSEPGWLIFRTGPSELGVHPTSGTWEGQEFSHPLGHSISLMCDDVAATRAELEAKGATFDGGIEDEGYGLVTMLIVPGAGPVQLYEPRHTVAFDLEP